MSHVHDKTARHIPMSNGKIHENMTSGSLMKLQLYQKRQRACTRGLAEKRTGQWWYIEVDDNDITEHDGTEGRGNEMGDSGNWRDKVQ